MVHIIKTIPEIQHELINEYKDQSTATVHEAMGRRGAMTSSIKPIKKGIKICGQALTVDMPAGDNLMLIKAVSMAKKGQIIVINNGNVVDSGPFGEVLAVECMTKGVAGLVTSGSIRDSQAVTNLGFGVFASGLSIIGTTKAAAGKINHSITCGNVVVNPGDIILGDDDGIVVVPLGEARDVLKAAKQRDAKEADIMQQLKTGASLFDLYNYQNIIDQLNITEE